MDELNSQKSAIYEDMCVAAHFRPVIGLYKSVKLPWQWRRLKWAVAAASEAAQGHEANGVRPGSKEFQTLFNELAKKVAEYSHDSGKSIETIKAKLPALCAIEKLANPDPATPQSKVGLTLGIVIVALLGSIGMGALIGLGTGMAHWIAHLFA